MSLSSLQKLGFFLCTFWEEEDVVLKQSQQIETACCSPEAMLVSVVIEIILSISFLSKMSVFFPSYVPMSPFGRDYHHFDFDIILTIGSK